jgi:uncharacterized protein (TIGR03382 family)
MNEAHAREAAVVRSLSIALALALPQAGLAAGAADLEVAVALPPSCEVVVAGADGRELASRLLAAACGGAGCDLTLEVGEGAAPVVAAAVALPAGCPAPALAARAPRSSAGIVTGDLPMVRTDTDTAAGCSAGGGGIASLLSLALAALARRRR